MAPILPNHQQAIQENWLLYDEMMLWKEKAEKLELENTQLQDTLRKYESQLLKNPIRKGRQIFRK